MIIDILIFVFLGLLNVLLQLLPEWTVLPVSVGNALSWVGEKISMFDEILPIDTLISCLLIIIGLEMGIQAWKILKFVLTLIRGTKI